MDQTKPAVARTKKIMPITSRSVMKGTSGKQVVGHGVHSTAPNATIRPTQGCRLVTRRGKYTGFIGYSPPDNVR